MVLTFYDSIVLFENYNILILYDYRYYCDFKIHLIFVFNDGVTVFGTHALIRIPCIIIRTPYIPLDKLYTIDEP